MRKKGNWIRKAESSIAVDRQPNVIADRLVSPEYGYQR